LAKRAVICAVATLAAACSASEQPVRPAQLDAEPDRAGARLAPATVLAYRSGGERSTLGRFDARTLRPVGRAIEVAGGGALAFSPDGRALAAASAVTSGPAADLERSELTLVDARSLRRTAGLQLRRRGLVWGILWERPGVFAVVLDSPLRVVTVKRRPLRAIGSTALAGAAVASDENGGRLVLLLAPRRGIGAARLAAVEPDGGVHTVALPAVDAGWDEVESPEGHPGAAQQIPGVAVSPDGQRAVVIPAGDRVYEVDLDSLRISAHDLSEGASLFRRLADWLQPAAEAKTVAGPDRVARWLGRHHIVVTGSDYGGVKDGVAHSSPAGLRLIDTRDWSVSTLAEDAAGMLVVDDVVLAYGWARGDGTGGIGLRAYDAAGRERFHLFGDAPLDWLEAAAPYAYVPRNGGTRFDVVDVRSGRVVGRPRPRSPLSIAPQ
jgi:hypothetical protein